jgi:hypothetical protein
MAALLTTATLAKWTQSDATEVAEDPFAVDLIDKVSQLICHLGGHPNWTLDLGADQAPIDVQMVALKVIKRSYENPGQVIQEGSIGPLGGDRVADIQALFLDLTAEERAIITAHNPDGDPMGPAGGAGQIFTIATTRGDESSLLDPTLYVGDNLQINLDSTNAAPEWKIPMFNPGDPGDPNHYV